MRILREQRLKRGERRRSARREREEERGKINACTHTIVQAVPLPDTPKMKSGKENPNCGEEYLQYDPVSEREGSLGHVAKTLRDVFISGDVTRGNFLTTSFATKLLDGARKNLPGVKRLILIIVSRWYNSATPNHSKMLLAIPCSLSTQPKLKSHLLAWFRSEIDCTMNVFGSRQGTLL